MKYQWKTTLWKTALYAVHLMLVAIVCFPLIFALVSSFRPLADVFRYVSPITWKTFFPVDFTWEAYNNLFALRGFGRVIFNTVYVTMMTVLFGVPINAMAAFALAKFKFKGRELLFLIVLFSFMIPFEIIAIPLYSIVNNLGWIDTYKGLIIPGIANGMVIFLFRQFFLDLPDSIIESARIDGASWLRIFFQIILPLSKPVTVSAALLTFIYQWESFMWPLIVTRSESLRVIQVSISYFTTEFATYWNEMFAASILAILPPIILILVLQRYFIEGIASTGSKEG